MADLGLIQVYTGSGKGKTTAGLGLALRAAGHGFKVSIVQFMKSPGYYGEITSAAMLPGLRLIPVGREGFVNLKNPEDIDCKLAQDGWELAKKLISSGQEDIVVLDEINVAMASGLVATKEVVSFLQEKSNQTEVVLTGQNAPEEIIAVAHLVTEMRKIRHPFDQNIPPRRGIDY